MEHKALQAVLLHVNFFDLFPWLSYTDCLSLAYAVYPVCPGFGNRLPKVHVIIDRMLTRLNIQTASFWLALEKANAVIHGSFLQHCLLEPLKMETYSSIFTVNSDIDIAEPNASLQPEVCPSCLRRLYEFKFPDDKKTPIKKMIPRLLGTNKECLHHKKVEKLKELCPIELNVPHIRKRHINTNALSSFLCYFGTLQPEPVDNYRMQFQSRLIWKLDKVNIDQITVWVDPKAMVPSLKRWLRKQADFDFGKVCFDGTKLMIANRRSLIKKESKFPIVYRDLDFELVLERAERVIAKGLYVDLDQAVVDRKNRIDHEREERRTRVREKHLRNISVGDW